MSGCHSILGKQDFDFSLYKSNLSLSPNESSCIYSGMTRLPEFNLPDAVAILNRTPASLNALLRGLPEVWVRRNEGNDSWNAYDIMGHLVFGEIADWMPRARILLEHGESRAFDRFDRLAQMKKNNETMEYRLDEFARLRKENLAALQALNLQPQDLNRRGKHPELGVVTLSQLLATWVAHDLTHVHQLSRVMSHQYREAVGPWSVYLGVLQCKGHSA